MDGFAEKINVLVDPPKLCRDMGEYNPAKVEKMFIAECMVKQYQELFETVRG